MPTTSITRFALRWTLGVLRKPGDLENNSHRLPISDMRIMQITPNHINIDYLLNVYQDDMGIFVAEIVGGGLEIGAKVKMIIVKHNSCYALYCISCLKKKRVSETKRGNWCRMVMRKTCRNCR